MRPTAIFLGEQLEAHFLELAGLDKRLQVFAVINHLLSCNRSSLETGFGEATDKRKKSSVEQLMRFKDFSSAQLSVARSHTG